MGNIVRRERAIPDLRREIDRLFEDFFSPGASSLMPAGDRVFGSFVPQLEIDETADGWALRAELPGVKPEEIELDVQDEVLSLRGEKKQEQQRNEGGYTYTERSYGSFARAIRLPPGVDAQKIEADFKDGVLYVRIPKGEAARARKIPLGAKSQETPGITAGAKPEVRSESKNESKNESKSGERTAQHAQR